MSDLVRTHPAGGHTLDPEALSSVAGGHWLVPPRPNRPVLGAAIDTRRIRPGNLFFAMTGSRVDGHDFLAAAAESGASIAVVERDPTGPLPPGLGVLRVEATGRALRALAEAYRDDLGSVGVIGVTGSNGKTTTVRLIHAALTGAGLTGTHAQKSENNHLGVPLTILNARPDDDFLLCEIGTNAPGEIADLAALARPDIGVITSIGRAHIERLGSVAGIAREKASLVRAVPAKGLAIVTADSPELDAELAGGLACPVVRVGVSASADQPVAGITPTEGGTRFRIGVHEAFVPMPGTHSATNAAIALAVAEAMGADRARSIEGLLSVVPPEMRLERSMVPCASGEVTLINDAYNANPESVRASIGMLSQGDLDPSGTRPRRVAVLGGMLEMGDQSGAVHTEIVGLVESCEGIDLALFVGPEFGAATPGGDPRLIALPGDGWIDEAARLIEAGDLVLLKGSRGMRLERLVDHLRAGARTGRTHEHGTGVG